ncbi:glycosyltransferase [Tateyamaria sp. SN6-1]|uniref:glycosyltransferase n=1 Tax=Tateyamaria sp. SN6-1 TaxID=3092148 RepID=UPI0039F50FAE
MEQTLVLVSRFNLPHPIWAGRSAEDYRTWLDWRIELFRRLTVQSVRNCYDKPDRWLIMVDTREHDFLDELTASVTGLPVTIVPYTGRDLPSSIRHTLSDLGFPRRILTCRLDTDDLVNTGFFKRLRSTKITSAEARAGTVISYPGGAIYDCLGDAFYFDNYFNNPFLCYVEEVDRSEDLRTVFCAQHIDLIDQSAHVKFLRSFTPFWASTIHDKNLANQSLQNSMQISFKNKRKLKRQFGIAPRGRDA